MAGVASCFPISPEIEIRKSPWASTNFAMCNSKLRLFPFIPGITGDGEIHFPLTGGEGEGGREEEEEMPLRVVDGPVLFYIKYKIIWSGLRSKFQLIWLAALSSAQKKDCP